MSLKQYLELLAAKIEQAEERRDVQECIRLAGVGRDALDEYIQKCEKVPS